MLPTPTSGSINWMQTYRDSAGIQNCGAFYSGERFKGTFDTSFSSVFSSYSNPPARTWNSQPAGLSIEILSQNGSTLNLRASGTGVSGSPAKRYLGMDPGVAADTLRYGALAWGAQWSGAQPLEPNVTWSECERSGDGAAGFTNVYAGTLTRFVDSTVQADTNGSSFVYYRARVKNSEGKFSKWSNVLPVRVSAITSVSSGTTMPRSAELLECYPNPFNPTTRIAYVIPQGAGSRLQGAGGGSGNEPPGLSAYGLRLTVYDVLGREVRVLVEGRQGAGVHTVQFDGSGLSSGVYFVRLQTEAGVTVRRVVLER
jgi:hypothetical protein